MKITNFLFLFVCTFGVMFDSINAYAGQNDTTQIVNSTMRIYGDDAYPVTYRRAAPVAAPRSRYPGFNPGVYILKEGTIRREGAKPLPCDILFERDVPMTLRDGTVMYTDVYRPIGNETVPAIVAWSPYGKEVGGQQLDDIPGRSGVPLSEVSELQKFEGPDPAYWVSKGYAILNPDARGAYSSQGNITYWGRQLAEDGYDFVEWAAEQEWSSGKIALSGNSWLAVSQWFIAAEQPPHLAAIAPWEGLSDVYRDVSVPGGFPSPSFLEMITTTFAGKGFVEDQPRMAVNNNFMNPYWKDKIARLTEIEVPAYIVASYTNMLHTRGTFAGFRDISTDNKWLRVHNTSEWPDYYNPSHVAELNQFFDRYLKDIDNKWEETPTVRLAILDPGNSDELDRPATSWPPPGQSKQRLFLNNNESLRRTMPIERNESSYQLSERLNSGSISFNYTVPELTEIIGYMKAHLWVEARGSDDMEIEVSVQKADRNGDFFTFSGGSESSSSISATGKMRVSMRDLDKRRSTQFEPYQPFTKELPLHEGEIVPVDIGLWPIALRFHPGERLVFTISALSPQSTQMDGGFGMARIPVPLSGSTFFNKTDELVSMLQLGGGTTTDFVNAQRVSTPKSRNSGTHVFHYGGDFDSHLLIPVSYPASS